MMAEYSAVKERSIKRVSKQRRDTINILRDDIVGKHKEPTMLTENATQRIQLSK